MSSDHGLQPHQLMDQCVLQSSGLGLHFRHGREALLLQEALKATYTTHGRLNRRVYCLLLSHLAKGCLGRVSVLSSCRITMPLRSRKDEKTGKKPNVRNLPMPWAGEGELIPSNASGPANCHVSWPWWNSPMAIIHGN